MEYPMNERQTVADYIVGRLAREGITDCFGVAGDFAFKLCDAVARSDAIRWIGCSNELGAAYAADGYARVRGSSMLLTTYAVGELSALNGVMGARAERSCVFHLVGALDAQAARPPDHPPHARRWGIPELRQHLGAGGVCQGGHHRR
jgi:indolepyruvate decarboxylase